MGPISINLITEPLANSFFIRGIIAAILVMIGGAVMGFGVITKRYAYLGQGVSQSMLAGVALGAVLGTGSTISAFIAAIIAATIISKLSKVKALGADTSVAIIASAAMSIGVIIISSDRSRNVNLNNILFGNVLGVSKTDLLILTLSVVTASSFNIINGRRLALACMSPSVAQAHGVNVRRIELQRLLMLSLVTAASVQIVGVTLVVAALVIPAATASLLTRTLGSAHLLAAIIATLIAIFGLYLSYWFDLASGPSVVITGTIIYTLAHFLKPSANR